jgi:ABC-type polysaccharide/polyol phosphate export permease
LGLFFKFTVIYTIKYTIQTIIYIIFIQLFRDDYIVGLDAAYCVKNTISAALNRGFEVLVIEDALISETKALKEEMIQYFKNNGVKIIRTFEYYGD